MVDPTKVQLTFSVQDLIDLPGIVAASIPGEPSDMMKKSRDLVSKFIKDPDTLVIAVVPANTRRIRDSQALQLVQEANAQARTIGSRRNF